MQIASTPPAGLPVEVRGLTKSFGEVRAVTDLSFSVAPGRVTGFLGPNGSGKTTTLRMLLGLVRPDAGTGTIGGRAYADLPRPASVVGAGLESASFHPGRSARGHLRVLAPLLGVPDSRCEQVLEQVGLLDVAERRVGGFSMGMRQRLALAAALLGNPGVLILDEPTNGLDPAGIVWLRDLLRYLAHEGRTVLLSSHVLGEVQAVVDDVVVISRGRLVRACSLPDLIALARHRVLVDGPDQAGLRAVLERHGWSIEVEDGVLAVEQTGGAGAPAIDSRAIGAALFAAGLEVHLLQPQQVSLEETFLALVGGPDSEVVA